MRLQVIWITILQAAMVKSLKEVSGYLGDNVTLPSEAGASWNLSKIEWSIFTNNTWIATYRNGRENIERFHQYKGRLSLNTTTGDLTIHNLSRKDAMDYSVDLENAEGQNTANKIKLTVTERLQKPNIEVTVYGPTEGNCAVRLRCSSDDQGVNFTWRVKLPIVIVTNTQDHYGSSVVAFLNTTQSGAEFTCTSIRQNENNSRSVFPECSVKPPPTPTASPLSPEKRCRYGVTVFVGVILGCLLSAVMFFFGGENKSASSPSPL
ncbi:CD48 antigen isoform X3 [Acanthopagrus latus]|uniref:CD48 antigen isoform X3 n=1 Tax=Acanthopagrus latus TaxID=8177 RepID=UPI00187C57E5|nr:CD48 antigen isoform X3 [Acanthopagrus latus]XP_036967020.1 CD48 antigen isoform X3 [Acanthopagrus latus]XP_036967021.1 CD48 antigen isoform X3 [Acanthopagrus latus]